MESSSRCRVHKHLPEHDNKMVKVHDHEFTSYIDSMEKSNLSAEMYDGSAPGKVTGIDWNTLKKYWKTIKGKKNVYRCMHWRV